MSPRRTGKGATWTTVLPYARMTVESLDAAPVGSTLSVDVNGLRLTVEKLRAGEWRVLPRTGVHSWAVAGHPLARRVPAVGVETVEVEPVPEVVAEVEPVHVPVQRVSPSVLAGIAASAKGRTR